MAEEVQAGRASVSRSPVGFARRLALGRRVALLTPVLALALAFSPPLPPTLRVALAFLALLLAAGFLAWWWRRGPITREAVARRAPATT